MLLTRRLRFLLRLLGERGDAIRAKLKREKTLKVKGRQPIGKAYAAEQKDALMEAAAVATEPTPPSGEQRTRKKPGTRSPFIKTALALAFNAGMRDAEISQSDLGTDRF